MTPGKKELINYSQCWEDAELMLIALDVKHDDSVLSVTSGGDNSLALLSKNPASLSVVDRNSKQNSLFELKHASIRLLNYKVLLAFLGINKTGNRRKTYYDISSQISAPAKITWDNNTDLVNKGVIHIGKFEKYLKGFRSLIIKVLFSERDIEGLLMVKSPGLQKLYYQDVWDRPLWRLFFRIFFSRPLLKRFGRGDEMFTFNTNSTVGNHYLHKTGMALSSETIFNNSYIDYILKGNYKNNTPYYLMAEITDRIKSSSTKLRIINSDLSSFLQKEPDNSISKFNLSDIFERMSVDETDELFKEILRVGKKGGRIIFWNNMVERDIPGSMEGLFKREKQLEKRLSLTDKIFFYDNFKIYTIA